MTASTDGRHGSIRHLLQRCLGALPRGGREIDVLRRPDVRGAREQTASTFQSEPAVGIAEHTAEETIPQHLSIRRPGIAPRLLDGPLRGPVELLRALESHSLPAFRHQLVKALAFGDPGLFASHVDLVCEPSRIGDSAPSEGVSQHARHEAQILAAIDQIEYGARGRSGQDAVRADYIFVIEGSFPHRKAVAMRLLPLGHAELKRRRADFSELLQPCRSRSRRDRHAGRIRRCPWFALGIEREPSGEDLLLAQAWRAAHAVHAPGHPLDGAALFEARQDVVLHAQSFRLAGGEQNPSGKPRYR